MNQQTEIKQPWEMTRGEFWAYGESLQEIQRRASGPSAYGQGPKISFTAETRAIKASDELARIKFGVPHEKHIQQAISEGKPVPASVLKDYPDLVIGRQTK